jgi:putative SOS response-associated peptidase YedK
MCGRFTNVMTWRELVTLYRITEERPAVNFPARYNIAPTQDVPVVRLDAAGARDLVMLRWGLVPTWAPDLKIGYSTINARAETVDTKPTFREAFRKRRCLVPASGYYEWKATESGKQPIYFTPAEGEATTWTFAGLWERWERAGQTVESFTIVVGPGNELAKPIHDRMPVILDAASHDDWLTGPPEAAKALLGSYPADRMRASEVSPRVGNVRTDDASLVQPLAGPADPPWPRKPQQPRLL